MRIAGILSLAVVAAALSAAHAGTETLTPEFREKAVKACTADAVRLCPLTLLDEEETAACMKINRAELSPGCRAVYDDGIRQQRP